MQSSHARIWTLKPCCDLLLLAFTTQWPQGLSSSEKSLQVKQCGFFLDWIQQGFVSGKHTHVVTLFVHAMLYDIAALLTRTLCYFVCTLAFLARSYAQLHPPSTAVPMLTIVDNC